MTTYLGTREKNGNAEKSEDDEKKKDKECWKLVGKKAPVGLTCTPGSTVPRSPKRILINYHQGRRIPEHETYALKTSHPVRTTNGIQENVKMSSDRFLIGNGEEIIELLERKKNTKKQKFPIPRHTTGPQFSRKNFFVHGNQRRIRSFIKNAGCRSGAR